MNSESREINAQAADWLARRDGPDFSAEDEAEFTRWLEASYRHRVAVLRLQHVWQEAERLKALGAGARSGEVPPAGQWHRSPFAEVPLERKARVQPSLPRAHSRARWWSRALAAAAILALIGGAWFWYGASHRLIYQTPVGAIETVAITDGSRVTLNTDSRIKVWVTAQERQIQLDRGEAFFEVAKDARRPFVVRAGRASVTAVGTQFSVRREGSSSSVVVTEGVVRIEDPDTAVAGGQQAAHAGQVARISDAGVLVQNEAVAKAEERLSWRAGVLIFRNTPLSQAVADFNRYNTRKIVIADPAVGELRVAGSFRATSAAAFVHMLGEAFALEVQERDGQFVLAPQAAAPTTH